MRRPPLLILPLLALFSSGVQAEHREAELRARANSPDTLQTLERNKPQQKKEPLQGVPMGPVVRMYRFLMEKADSETVRAEAFKRLADINMDLSELRLLAETEGEQAGTSAGIADLGFAGLNRGFEESIELYGKLVQQFPDYPGMDGVLYQLAKAYDLNGAADRALQPLSQLVDRFPASRYFAEAQFRRGEILFDEKDYDRSQAAYAAVLNLGETSPYYEQARYKRGWSLFKRGEYRLALNDFFPLLDRLPQGQFDALDLPENERQLVDDTYRVISLSFGYLVGTYSIKQFFADYGRRPYEPSVYSNLGEHLLKQERYHDAANAYQQFSETHPDHPRSPLFQAGAVNAYRAGGFAALARPQQERFVNTYGVDTPYWKGAQVVIRAQILPHLRAYLPELAQYYHARAQDKKDPEDFRRAAGWYAGYLKAFGDEPDAPRYNFLLAETLYESRQFDRAAEEYYRVAYQRPGAEAKQRPEAGYAAFTAFQARGRQLQGEQLATWRERTVEAGQRFAREFPEDKRRLEVSTAVAEEQLALGRAAAAVATAQETLKARPATELRQRLWKVSAHGAFESGDYRLAERAADEVLDFTKRGDKEYPVFRERLAGAIYRQGERARDGGEQRAAVDHFLRVGERVPESPFRVNARYDAGTVLMAMSAWDEAIDVLGQFRKDYPDHNLAKDVTIKLALAYEGAGQFDKAAAELQRVASLETDRGVAAEAAWNAAELFARAEQPQQAIDQFKAYVNSYPQPFERNVEARNRLAELYAQRKDEARQTYWLKQIISGHKGAGKQATPRTQYLAAGAAFTMADLSAREFQGIRLTLPLEQSLDRKQKALKRAIDAYGEAAKFGAAEYTTASTFRIGEIYRQLGSDMLASERPRDLNAEELEQYDILLEEEAFPFEEKAIEVHEINGGRAREGIYDQWVRRSFEALAAMLPARYAKREEGEAGFELLP